MSARFRKKRERKQRQLQIQQSIKSLDSTIDTLRGMMATLVIPTPQDKPK